MNEEGKMKRFFGFSPRIATVLKLDEVKTQ